MLASFSSDCDIKYMCTLIITLWLQLYNTITTTIYVSGSSKTQTLLASNVDEIVPQGLKFCNSVEKYQILLGGNVWILLEPHIYNVPYCIIVIILLLIIIMILFQIQLYLIFR